MRKMGFHLDGCKMSGSGAAKRVETHKEEFEQKKKDLQESADPFSSSISKFQDHPVSKYGIFR
jgi:hypothetical protein